MAAYENTRNISVQTLNTNGVAAAIRFRFATWKAGGGQREVVAHQPATASGEPAVGIIAMKSDVKNVPNGLAQTSIVVPDGGIANVELGEAVTAVGQKLRVGGGGSGEVAGRAYLADASGDYIVGEATETGNVGEVIAFSFANGGKLP